MNVDELRERFAAIRAAAPQLNHVTDQATQAVRSVEQLLDELAIAASASACFHQTETSALGENLPTRTTTSLCYGRVGDRFKIYVMTEVHECESKRWFPVSVEKAAWDQCNRETKLDSVVVLPKLLCKIIDRMSEIAEKGAKATSVVRDLMASLKPADV